MREQNTSRHRLNIENRIENLCFERLNADEKILGYWKLKKISEPELYELANIVLAVPATQVSVERAFSGVGLVLTARRTQLSEKSLADILLVKLNSEIFEASTIQY